MDDNTVVQRSEEPLVSIVTSTLEERGVLSKIRAQLRANVFSAIHEQQLPQTSSNTGLKQLQEERPGQLAALVSEAKHAHTLMV